MKNKFIKIVQLGDPNVAYINIETLCVMRTMNSDQLYLGCEGSNQATLTFKNERDRNNIFNEIWEKCLFYFYNLLIKINQGSQPNNSLYAISKNKICTMGKVSINKLYIGCKGNNDFTLSFENEEERDDFLNKILYES